MILLPSLDLKHDTNLREKSLGAASAKVRLGVEAQGPPAAGLQVTQDILERVDGDLARGVRRGVRQPGLDAAVVVGGGLEDDGERGRVVVLVAGSATGGGACGGGSRSRVELEADGDVGGRAT